MLKSVQIIEYIYGAPKWNITKSNIKYGSKIGSELETINMNVIGFTCR